jgi:hypothetical protein
VEADTIGQALTTRRYRARHLIGRDAILRGSIFQKIENGYTAVNLPFLLDLA